MKISSKLTTVLRTLKNLELCHLDHANNRDTKITSMTFTGVFIAKIRTNFTQ